MKIGRKTTRRKLTQNQFWLAALALVFIGGVLLGGRGLSQAAADYWSDTLTRLRASNGGGDLPTLIIDMPFANYDNLLNQREEALARNVFIAADEDFQSATIRLDDAAIPVRLRLQQGTAVHLGDDDKWNFDIRTRDNQLLLGLQRFYLIDPADNNWLNEWAFMQSLRREEVMSARYQFVRLVFNGDDRGIYALQEGFGQEMMVAQDRPEGVIVEFDATGLWESIDYADGDAVATIADPVTNLTADDFQFFEVDTFRDATIARDDALSAQKNAAIGLLRGLQRGDLAASDVFDIEQYGRFLALADLWGATGATSLFNLRYYYHPESGKLEPIGFNTAPDLEDPGRRISLAATYNDPALQAAYAAAAWEVSRPEYLTALQAALEPDWRAAQESLQGEVELTPPWELLAQRQALLSRSLEPLQPVFAYLGPPSLSMQAIIQVDVANVLNLPVEIAGFDISGATFLEADRAWLQGDWADLLIDDSEKIVLKAVDEKTPALQFVRFHLPLVEIIKVDDELDFMQELDIGVATRILGLERATLTLARPGFPDPVLIPGSE